MTGKNIQFDDMEGGIYVTGDVNHTKTHYYEAPPEANTWKLKPPIEVKTWKQTDPDMWKDYLEENSAAHMHEYEFTFSGLFTPEEFYRLGRTLTREFYVEEVKYRKL